MGIFGNQVDDATLAKAKLDTALESEIDAKITITDHSGIDHAGLTGVGDVNPTQVTPTELTAGTEVALRSFAPADVASMAGTHGGGGADLATTLGLGGTTGGTSITISSGDSLTSDADLSVQAANNLLLEAGEHIEVFGPSSFSIYIGSDQGSNPSNNDETHIDGGFAVLIGASRSDGVGIGRAGGDLGFYGSSGINQPTITGSRSANPALANLLSSLAAQGLIVDGTTV